MANYRPRIILSAAISIDGKISTKSGDSKLSSKRDLIRLHKLRSRVDGILIGKNTLNKDNPLLTVRHLKGKNPIRIILDSKGTISKNSNILQTSRKVKTIIVVSKKISTKNIQKLQKFPVEILILGENKVDIKLLIKTLGKRKIRNILVEGGGLTNWEFIKANLVDEFFITITPYIIGGKNAISLVQGDGFTEIKSSPKLQLKMIKKYGNDLFLNYKRI